MTVYTLAPLIAIACSLVQAQDALPRLGGQVVTLDGTPVAAARVKLHLTGVSGTRHWPDRLLAEATSNADGFFDLELPERSVLIDELFCLCVTHRDHAPAAVYEITPWDPPSLTPLVRLKPGEPAEGRVLTRAGEPADGAEVEVYHRLYGVPAGHEDYLVAKTLTDQKGRYAFPRYQGHGRVVARVRDGDEVESIGLKPTLRVTKASTANFSRIERYRAWGHDGASVVAGRVLDAATREPVKLFAIGVARRAVELWPAPWERELFGDGSPTDPGSFRYRTSPGKQTLGVFADGYAMRLVTTESTKKPDLGEILLERGAPLSGRVVDNDGVPLSGARVHVQPSTWEFGPLASYTIGLERYWVPQAFTDAEGRYRIDHVAAGSVTVTAASARYAPAMSTPMEVGTKPVEVPELRLEKGGRIVGRVVNGSRLSIDGVTVPLRGDRFSIEGLPSGSYELMLSGNGCLVASQNVAVVAGKMTEVEIVR